MKQFHEQQLQAHIPIVGWLLIVGHAIFLVVAGFVFVLLTGIGVSVRDAVASSILFILATAVASLLGLLAIPGLVAGVGLLLRKSWARILAIAVAILGFEFSARHPNRRVYHLGAPAGRCGRLL